MRKEEKEKNLTAAIQLRDLEKVKNLVEEHGCPTSGPGPWDQVPLKLAAESGRIDIVEYLIRNSAEPDETTLTGALDSNILRMVQYVSDECNIEWSARHFEKAFEKRFEICRYAFEVAGAEGWFEKFFVDHAKDPGGQQKFRIIYAAREALINACEYDASNLVDFLKIVPNENVLDSTESDSRFGWMNGFIKVKNVAGFAITWKAVHQMYFDGKTHAELDLFSGAEAVHDFFYSAIEHQCDEVFYFMLSYTLPNLDRCVQTATRWKREEILNYLSKRLQPYQWHR